MIHFDTEQKTFILGGKSSVYVMRVRESGELVHMGFVPAAQPKEDAIQLSGLSRYPSQEFNLDPWGWLYELPATGDVYHHPVGLEVSFPEPPKRLSEVESNHTPVRDLRLRYSSHSVVTDEAPALAPQHGLPVKSSAPRETLKIELKDEAYPFEATLFYRVSPESDVIERWVELRNRCGFPVRVERCDFGGLFAPNGRYEATYVTGVWAREFHLARTEIKAGQLSIEGQALNTGHFTNPFVYLTMPGECGEAQGTVYFAALAYGGAWQMRVDRRPSGAVQLLGGYHPRGGAFDLAPGEKHRTPAIVVGCTDEGLSGASQRLHQFTHNHVLPRPQSAELRPVLYNSWEATYFNLSLEGQISLARTAAEMGVELFVVDDGWFGGRRNDRAGLGDWYVSNDVFPDGLQPLIDEVRKLGMKFGIWVEPEMVNPDSDLYRAHPDWILHYPGRPRTTSRHQCILDFGRPEVVQNIQEQLTRLLDEYEIDFIKWDMNRYASEPGSAAGEAIWRRHIEAVYGLMDNLRKRYPRLTIESCSSGGGRADLGVFGRTDQAWTSDDTDAMQRLITQEGYSYAYPARTMMNWVTDEINQQTGWLARLPLRFDVAMRGSLGIGSPIDKLPPEERAEYAKFIAFYKKIRHVVQEGTLHRLVSLFEYGVSVWQFASQDQRESVVSFVEERRRFGEVYAPPRLKGLNPALTYACTDYLGRDLGKFSGWQLMTLGLPKPQQKTFGQEASSWTVWLKAE